MASPLLFPCLLVFLVSSVHADFGAPVIFQPDTGLNEPRVAAPNNQIVADLNGDGHLDTVVASFNFPTTYYWLGNGDGTFGTFRPLIPQASGGLAFHDFNGDGIGDLLVGRSIYLGDGNGNFPTVNPVTQNASYFNAVADMNNDGYLDVVAYGGKIVDNNIVYSLSIYYNAGDATFESFEVVFYDTAYGEVKAICAADFNRDGKGDIIVVDYDPQTNGFSLVSKNGETWETTVLIGGGWGASECLVLDVDSDGWLDVVGVTYFGDAVGFFPNQNGTLGALVDLNGDRSLPLVVSFGDINGDGNATDIAAAQISANQVMWWFSEGTGTYSSQNQFDNGERAWTIALGDFNSDGCDDLVYGRYTSVAIRLWQNCTAVVDTATSTSSSITGTAVTATTDDDTATESESTSSTESLMRSPLTALVMSLLPALL